MLGENKNLKDTSKDSVKDTSSVPAPLASSWMSNSGTHTKTNKLITALYMVTDIMDKDEPMRLKLRTLGVEILSDTTSLSKGNTGNLDEKIATVLSFLNIAFDMGMISEMNSSILKKEFMELKQSIKELKAPNNLWLGDFMSHSENKEIETTKNKLFSIGQITPAIPIGQMSPSFSKGQSTRIGVQKGSTLLKALHSVREKTTHHSGTTDSFELLKNKRREEIVSIIQDKKKNTGIDGATITDIKNAAKGTLVSCGEKTLQRELVSMVSDNLLYRTGSKRWSHYFVK